MTLPTRRIRELLCLFAAFAAIDLFLINRQLPRAEFGDEWRYLLTADNLLHGFFSPRGRVLLWNGPMYPITLMPFVKIGWLDGARYLNAFWHAGAVAYAWALARPHARWWISLAIVAVLGCYPPLYEHLPLIYTETFAFFLTTAWVYHGLRGVGSRWHCIAGGVLLSAIALTKVVFGPVLMVYAAGLLAAWLLAETLRRSAVVRAFLVQALLAVILCAPYLAYTYSLTGRFLYWSSAGANNFYWLTSPFDDEWGDWYHQGWVYSDPALRAHHGEIFERASGLADNPNLSDEEQLLNLSTPEASDIFLDRGLQNVREHPAKFARNWAANVVRFFLDVPVSVRGTPLWNVYSLAHLPMLAFTLVVSIYAWRRRVRLPAEWVPLVAFALLALAAHSLVAAMARFAIPLVPLWWLAVCAWTREIKSASRT